METDIQTLRRSLDSASRYNSLAHAHLTLLRSSNPEEESDEKKPLTNVDRATKAWVAVSAARNVDRILRSGAVYANEVTESECVCDNKEKNVHLGKDVLETVYRRVVSKRSFKRIENETPEVLES